MNKRELIYLVLALIVINASMIVWSYYDHALPVYDMASHLVSGFACRDLFAHMHLRSLDWWRSLLAVNPLYPPLVYIAYGSLKLLFGPERWVDTLVRILFSNILYVSVYGLARLIFKKPSIALLSTLFIFVYPHVFTLTHYDMLDIPGLAMVALSLLCFIWWQEKTSLLSSICLGITCVLACLTKNNEIVFLVPPLLIALIQYIWQHDWHRVRTLLLAGLVSLITILPWLILAFYPMLKIVTRLQDHSNETGFITCSSFINNLWYYLSNMPSIVSPFLLILFVLAFCLSPKPIHKRMFYLSCSGAGGILLLSLFHWNHQYRYELAATIPMSIYSAWATVHSWQRTKLRPILVVLGLLVLVAFLQANFSPYPLPRIYLPEAVAAFLGIPPGRSDNHHAPGGSSMYPTPSADWGYEWAIEKIKPCLGTNQQSLCVMPNSEEVSATSYSYLVKRENNLALSPFTPRNWTMLGDELSFRQSVAMLVNWYLLKTGSPNSPGSHFCGKESELAYNNWCAFIRTSGKFKLIGTKTLPDGTQLELYKNLYY